MVEDKGRKSRLDTFEVEDSYEIDDNLTFDDNLTDFKSKSEKAKELMEKSKEIIEEADKEIEVTKSNIFKYLDRFQLY